MKRLHIHGCTDKGPVRKSNEDHILVARIVKNRGQLSLTLTQDDDWLARYGLLCAVADGVGGESGGAIASLLTLNALETHFYSSERAGDLESACRDALEAATTRANETLLTQQSERPELARMGCTLAGVCLTPSGYLVFSAGDSRVYRVRDGVVRALTVDDTLTNAQKNAGIIDDEEEKRSADRHTLLNLLGSHSFQLRIKANNEFRDGDLILICSDGIHDLISHQRIKECLSGNNNIELDVQALCEAAIAAGGGDNLSAILIELSAPASHQPGKTSMP
jgi:PPM family protein phosphatase